MGYALFLTNCMVGMIVGVGVWEFTGRADATGAWIAGLIAVLVIDSGHRLQYMLDVGRRRGDDAK